MKNEQNIFMVGIKVGFLPKKFEIENKMGNQSHTDVMIIWNQTLGSNINGLKAIQALYFSFTYSI